MGRKKMWVGGDQAAFQQKKTKQGGAVHDTFRKERRNPGKKKNVAQNAPLLSTMEKTKCQVNILS